MSVVKKIALMSFSLCSVILLFSYIDWLLGGRHLLIVGHIELSTTTLEILGFVLFAINFMMSACIILDIYDVKVYKIGFPYLVCYPLVEFLFSKTFVASFALPFTYLLLVASFHKSFLKSFRRFLILIALLALYQMLELTIKTNGFSLGYNELSPYQTLIFSIDLIVFQFILFCIGGERNGHIQFAIHSQAIGNPILDRQDGEAIRAFSELKGWTRVKAVALLLGFQLTQWSLILLICRLGNVFWEGLVITASYVCFGFFIKRRWHSNSVLVCTFVSIALFYMSARAIVPFEISQFVPVLTGLLLIYALYRVAIFSEMKEEADGKRCLVDQSHRCE